MNAFVWPILGGLLGLVAGSFLATLVLRWPRGASLSGRSRCDGCGVTLGPADLVPLLSFARLKGRCRSCGTAIDSRHPAIEAAAAAIGILALAAVPGPEGLTGALLGWVLLACLVLDLEHFWLPDALTLPLLALGLLLGPAPLADRLLGAALGGGGLLAIALAFRALTGRDGLGMGDAKLMAALGAWLSPAFLPPLLLVAALAGLAFAGVRSLRRPAGESPGDAEVRVPFGACLAVAGFPLWLAASAGLVWPPAG
jgi:leader peptidase (prepilin peptidase)/N-methyltransferase